MRYLRFLLLSAVFCLESAWAQAPNNSTITLTDRIYVASRVYSTLRTYFDHWVEVPELNFENAYREYLGRITQSDDRRTFDLETMRFVALLKNGHTWFGDPWLEETDGMPLGFYARPIGAAWVITTSQISSVHPGDVIESIDDMPVEDAFQQARQFLSNSSEREQRSYFFAVPVLFPREFSLKLTNGQVVRIERKRIPVDQKDPVSGRWLQKDSIAYLKIASFNGSAVQTHAIDYLRQFKAAKTLIIDLRGNLGGRGDPPQDLQLALLDHPVRSWREYTAGKIGRLDSVDERDSEIFVGQQWLRPGTRPVEGHYTGKLIFLIDVECVSYCEDFVMPFKGLPRATLIGETTAGSYSQTYFLTFDNGMLLNTATTREVFPGGSQFEGVGIAPSMQVTPTPADLKNETDIVLQKALEIARQ